MLLPCIALAVALVCLAVVVHNARRTWQARQQITLAQVYLLTARRPRRHQQGR